MAATPKRVDSTRSNAVGVPPRCTWPSITTLVSKPVRSPDLASDHVGDAAKADVAEVVVHPLADVDRARDRLGALGHDHDRRIPALFVAPGEVQANLLDVEGDLRDQHHAGAAGDAGVGGDPAAVAAHHLDDHHPVVALGGRVQPVDRLGGDLHCGVEAERHVRADESLSIVLGTPTIGRPSSSASAGAMVREPLPPTTISASIPRSLKVCLISSTPSG